MKLSSSMILALAITVKGYTFDRLNKSDAALLVIDHQIGLSELMHPTAPYIKRQGEVNAWDNANFRTAVEATGKKQLIIGGIVTEVCTSFLALSLVEASYDVWANTEASGTFSDKLASDANRRMEQAGVHLMGLFGMTMDLMRDWRNSPGSAEVLPYLDKYLVPYSLVACAHGYAMEMVQSKQEKLK
ncbi:hypothetical protein SBOR_7143 [Sclerotinia borealis F-4128]|uniref:Isochorismatase-like domain-containing protein n=1 Tax=Sclerotinia borealis (strain F-4128) TaxID=1432307 RepID=W9CD56_SCLBF|nr:hypothetical protein SBOR_7143 [Sclerotinia borealis F-4128]